MIMYDLSESGNLDPNNNNAQRSCQLVGAKKTQPNLKQESSLQALPDQQMHLGFDVGVCLLPMISNIP